MQRRWLIEPGGLRQLPRRVRRMAARLASVVLLTGFSLFAGGCHDLFCSVVEGLTGQPLDCSHDVFVDVGDVEVPSLPPPPRLPAYIDWDEPVVAGEPEELVAVSALGDSLRYRWDLDEDGAYDDHDAVGNAGKVALVRFENPGTHRVHVRISRAGDLNPPPGDTQSATATIDVQPGRQSTAEPPPEEPPAPPAQEPPPPPPPPPPSGSPPPANPLTVAIELRTVYDPETYEELIEVTGRVTRDGAAVVGASADFDFESDGTTDAARTTGAAGTASATHRYEPGDHEVTVTARHGGASGTGKRTFSFPMSRRAPAARAALAGRPSATAAGRRRPARAGRRFSARLVMGTLTPGRLLRTRTAAGRLGELAIGRLTARARGGTRAQRRRLRALLNTTWVARTDLVGRPKERRVRVSGIALATFAQAPGQACLRLDVVTRPGRRLGRFSLRLLSGTGRAVRTRALATGLITPRRDAYRLRGRLRTRRGAPRSLHPRCAALRAQIRALPG